MYSKLQRFSLTNEAQPKFQKQLKRQRTVSSSGKGGDLDFDPDIAGKPCVVREKKSDHLIRMNYIRYVKTQFQEMQLKEAERRMNQGMSLDPDIGLPDKFQIFEPGQEQLTSKVFELYYKYVEALKGEELDGRLLSIEEYVKHCEELAKNERKAEYYNPKPPLSETDEDTISQQQQTRKARFKIPVLDITPRSQQTRRNIPRTYLRAMKRSKNTKRGQNNDALQIRKLKALEDAMSMLQKIQNIGSSASEKTSSHMQPASEPKPDDTNYGFHQAGDKDRKLDSSQSNKQYNSDQSYSGNETPKHVIYQKANQETARRDGDVIIMNEDLTQPLGVVNEHDTLNNDTSEYHDTLEKSKSSFLRSKFNPGQTSNEMANPSIERVEPSPDENSIRRVVIARNKIDEQNKLNNSYMKISDVNYNTRYNDNQEYADMSEHYRAPFKNVKLTDTAREMSNDDQKSTVFITNNNSSDRIYGSKRKGERSLKHYSQNSSSIIHLNSSKPNLDSSTYASQSNQIIGPPTRNLHGFMQTYFDSSGEKQTPNIFPKLPIKKKLQKPKAKYTARTSKGMKSYNSSFRGVSRRSNSNIYL